MKLVTSAQMQKIDREAIDNVGIPGPDLMENAGRGIAEAILEDLIGDPESMTVAVSAARETMAGDGFVIARYLEKAGVTTSTYFMGPIDKLSPDARLNFDRLAGMGSELAEIKEPKDLPPQIEADFIIDAVFGTGFSGSPRGLSAEIIDYINLQDLPVVAVDMPSGLNADNGLFEGCVVEADFTYTLALPKFGLFISPGRDKSGTVSVIPIGIPDSVIEKFDLKCNLNSK